jgi:hypothetical protein
MIENDPHLIPPLFKGRKELAAHLSDQLEPSEYDNLLPPLEKGREGVGIAISATQFRPCRR